MARKVARQRAYDIPFIGAGITPVRLSRKQSDALARILGRRPSREFMGAYCYLLATYVAYRASVSRSTVAAVHARIERVINAAKTLQNSLNDLELTDRMLFNRVATKYFLRDQPRTHLNELSGGIAYFLPVIEEAQAIIKKEETRGRMPAYAERALARSLCSILFEETGVKPTARANGTFDRLLRLAFTHAKNGNPRNDVVDLLRFSLPHTLEEPLPLLPLFRNTDETNGSASENGTGINPKK
jgi:hypothetical protein